MKKSQFNPPFLGHDHFNWYQSKGSLFRLNILENGQGSGGLPKLDGRNYAYWKTRMAGYLEAINPIAWAVTEKPIVGPWNED